jgi:hypothetical protein
VILRDARTFVLAPQDERRLVYPNTLVLRRPKAVSKDAG